MEALHKIRKGIDTVLSSACVLLFAMMVVVGTYQIVTRFIFNKPSTVSEELLTYTFAWMAMLASAYVFGKRDHMKMSFLVDKLPEGKRRVLDIVIEVLIVFFAAAVLIYGWCYNHESDNDTENSISWSIHGCDLRSYADQWSSDCSLRTS